MPRRSEIAYLFAVASEKGSQFNPSDLSIRLLSLVETKAGSKRDVHLLRTTIRRLEVQLPKAPAKVAKCLKRLRKKAGQARDTDVYLDLLEAPLATPRSAHREAISVAQKQLRQILQDRRDRYLGSLKNEVADARQLLEARLPALVESAPRSFNARDAHRRISQARTRFLQLTSRVPTDPQQLHRLRIETKKLRYALEPLQAFEESVEAVAKFKQVQDAIGNWHDWETLAQLAQRKLPSSAGPLCAVLQARAAREYNKARRSAQNVRSWIAGDKPVPSAQAPDRTLRLVPKAG